MENGIGPWTQKIPVKEKRDVLGKNTHTLIQFAEEPKGEEAPEHN